MNSRNALSFAIGVALLGSTVAGPSLAQAPSASNKWWTPQNQEAQTYRQGPNHGWNRAGFEGRWLSHDRYDSNDRPGFQRGAMLPDFLTIDQERRLISIADGRNNVLQTIALGNGNGYWHQPAGLLQGQIQGNQLFASGTDSRGRHMTQTMSLQNRGRTLVIHTQVERGRSGRLFQFDKVYQRA